MIEEISISDLDPRLIKQLETADKALQNNSSYSMENILGHLAPAPWLCGTKKETSYQAITISREIE